MALPSSKGDREYKKFVEDANGDVAVRTVGSTGSAIGGVSQASGLAVYYAKPSGTNADASVEYTSETTITVTGLPFTFTEYDIESIEQIPTSGDSTVYSDKTDFSVSSGVITVAGAAFDSGDNFIVKIVGAVKGYDKSNDAGETSIINPDPFQYSDVVTVFNAVTADTTANYDVSTVKSVYCLAVSSDTADLHASIDVLASYDNGTNFYDLPGQAVSLTRNMNYGWWINTSSITDIQFNFDEITSTAGTVTLYMMKSFQEAPNPQLPPYVGQFRETAALTGSYVTGKELFVEGLKNLSIVSEFVAGATGATDEWSPSYEIEFSRTRTGDNWAKVQIETVGADVVVTDAVYDHGTAPVFTTADETWKKIITSFTNQGYKRIRVGVKDDSTPSNAATVALYLIGN